MFDRLVKGLRKQRKKGDQEAVPAPQSRSNSESKTRFSSAEKPKKSTTTVTKPPKQQGLWSGAARSLKSAVSSGNLAAVQQLLQEGTDPNEWTDRSTGKSLLHIAAEKGHGEVAEELLKAGADVDALTSDGQTPLHVARRHKQYPTGVVIRKHGGKDYSQVGPAKPSTKAKPSSPVTIPATPVAPAQPSPLRRLLRPPGGEPPPGMCRRKWVQLQDPTNPGICSQKWHSMQYFEEREAVVKQELDIAQRENVRSAELIDTLQARLK